MPRPVVLIEEGTRFWCVVVWGRAGVASSGAALWSATCDCGRDFEVTSSNFTHGFHRSCGCKRWRQAPRKSSGTYATWSAMRARCNNPHVRNYKNYGGRGIVCCSRWDVFTNFLADMGERPLGMSLDRIDNDGPYEAANCRWSTPIAQASNRRKRITQTNCRRCGGKFDLFVPGKPRCTSCRRALSRAYLANESAERRRSRLQRRNQNARRARARGRKQ